MVLVITGNHSRLFPRSSGHPVTNGESDFESSRFTVTYSADYISLHRVK
jgi:hypothetical protein